MVKKYLWVSLLISVLMMGCDAALMGGGRTVGVSSGTFTYTDGFLYSQYNASFDQVWKACEQTLAGMKAVDVTQDRKIAKGTFNAVVQDEKVVMVAEYVMRGETTVAIRAGVTGNNLASKLLHEQIAALLAKP